MERDDLGDRLRKAIERLLDTGNIEPALLCSPEVRGRKVFPESA